MNEGVYLDNASTSCPKPEAVTEAITSYLRDAGCSPGRSGHSRGRRSDDLVDQARRRVAAFLGCPDHRSIAYTYNATYALNLAVKGFVRPGDHVVVTCYEHNSVLRPLEQLRRDRIADYSVSGIDADGRVDVQAFADAFRPTTRLAVVTHASNVTGIVSPLADLVRVAHEHGARILADLSQTAGFLDIELAAWDVDYAAFAGHKSLLGLPGIGGLYVKDPESLHTVVEGGSGGNSADLGQPREVPTRFEPGTCNYTGIVALGAAADHLSATGPDRIRAHERRLLAEVTGELAGIPGIVVHGDVPVDEKVAVVSFTLDGQRAEDVADRLDREFGVMTRAGLHCAPLAHEALGTAPDGTVRVSLGPTTTDKDCSRLLEAVRALA